MREKSKIVGYLDRSECMLIPLGLGVKVPKFPFITIYLVILNVFFFFQQDPIDFKAIEQMISKKQTHSLISYYKSKDLLNKENISVTSLYALMIVV